MPCRFYNENFAANWNCLGVFTVLVICPKPAMFAAVADAFQKLFG